MDDAFFGSNFIWVIVPSIQGTRLLLYRGGGRWLVGGEGVPGRRPGVGFGAQRQFFLANALRRPKLWKEVPPQDGRAPGCGWRGTPSPLGGLNMKLQCTVRRMRSYPARPPVQLHSVANGQPPLP